MYSYIVVDDEVFIRKGIIKKINSISNGAYTCVGEAANGCQAIELIHTYHPDILITDMQMRNMTGVQLLDELREELSHLAIIIISGYQNWEYLSKAIEKKVVGYLLKPFSTEEIAKLLEKAGEQIEYQRRVDMLESEAAARNESKTSNECFPVLAKEKTDAGKETLLKYVQETDFLQLTAVIAENRFYYKKLQDMVSHIFDESLYYLMEDPLYKHFIYLFFHGPANEKIAFMEKREELFSQILSEESDEKCILLISSVHNVEEYDCLYYECDRMLRKIMLNKKRMKLAFDEQECMPYQKILSAEQIEEKISALKYHPDQTSDIMKRFFSQLDIKRHSLGDIYHYLSKIISSVNLYAANLGVETEDIMHVFLRKYALECGLESMERAISGYVNLIMMSLQQHYSSKEYMLVAMKEYIDRRYNQKITLQMLADEFYISYAYCGSLIKDYFHMSFNEYLTKVRISHAKILLEQTDHPAEIISSMVGYSNPKYFFKIFKEEEGKTPISYKKEVGESGGKHS